MDPAEVASIVQEAAASRGGWEVILARCAPTKRPRPGGGHPAESILRSGGLSSPGLRIDVVPDVGDTVASLQRTQTGPGLEEILPCFFGNTLPDDLT